MALESATYIDGLVTSNPTGSDNISQGDEHIRLIKTVLKNTIPNAASATVPIVKFTTTNQSTSSTIRSDTYADIGWAITHDKVSSTSTLYVSVHGMIAQFSSWDTSAITHQYTWIQLSNTSGTLISGSTANILIADMKEDGFTITASAEVGFGFSHLWKVTAAQCPDGTSGNNTFDIWTKAQNAGSGGSTFATGVMSIMEVEE
jgi:hypothetical protein